MLRSYLYMKRGDYRQARASAEQGLAVVQKHMGGHRVHASTLHAILAAIAYEFGEIEALEQHAVDEISTADDYGHADSIILKYLSRARLHFVRGDYDGGLAVLHNGRQTAHEHGLERARLSLVAEECAWLCRLGRVDQARQVAAEGGIKTHPDADNPPSGLQLDKAYRSGTRIQLHDDPQAAARALVGAIDYCEKRGFMHRAVELMLIQVSAYRRSGDHDRAGDRLRQALAIGAARGYHQIFLEEAHELGQLLQELRLDTSAPEQAAAAPLLARLQQALQQTPQTGSKRQPGTSVESAGAGLVEKLSKRESQIVRRLDSELSNREIAEAIFVSEGTLKWHLHNIYGKLGVKNRSGALNRARELNYLR